MIVLVVDADADLVDLLDYALRRAGHTVLTALDGDRALRCLEVEHPDMVLLDVAVPRVDGFDICRRIRQRARTPVILLAERSAEVDILHGFESGADDYVTKPFSAKQLLARMQAVLRRYQTDPARFISKKICVGELVFDPETRCVIKAGRLSKPVTWLEFSLLYHLALNAGQVVPYSSLIKSAWGYYDEDSATLLKTHVSHLRRKLGLPRQGPCSITAISGMGYRLAEAWDELNAFRYEKPNNHTMTTTMPAVTNIVFHDHNAGVPASSLTHQDCPKGNRRVVRPAQGDAVRNLNPDAHELTHCRNSWQSVTCAAGCSTSTPTVSPTASNTSKPKPVATGPRVRPPRARRRLEPPAPRRRAAMSSRLHLPRVARATSPSAGSHTLALRICLHTGSDPLTRSVVC